MIKTIIGVDISKNSFHACVKTSENIIDCKIKGTKSFDNNQKGFDLLLDWAKKRIINSTQVQFVMEATGVYYEDLAYFLYANKFDVGVVLANKMNSYAKSLSIKTKTDKVDSSIIASFGIERKVQNWKPMSPLYKELRDLSREFMSLKKEIQRSKNQIHAMKHAHEKTLMVIELKEEQIKFYEDKKELLREEIKRVAKQDKEFYAKVQKVETLPGVGFETVIGIICETNGFELFHSIRQLISYAGMDVVFNQSGAFNGKTRISKRGNARIRQILYMPTLSAIQHNSSIKNLYERVVEKNPNIKSKGVVAGMRKLLIYVFILWTKNVEYDGSYQWSNNILTQ